MLVMQLLCLGNVQLLPLGGQTRFFLYLLFDFEEVCDCSYLATLDNLVLEISFLVSTQCR